MPLTPGNVGASFEFLGVKGTVNRNPVTFPSAWGPLSSIGDYAVNYGAYLSSESYGFEGLRLAFSYEGGEPWIVGGVSFDFSVWEGGSLRIQVSEPPPLVLVAIGAGALWASGRRRAKSLW